MITPMLHISTDFKNNKRNREERRDRFKRGDRKGFGCYLRAAFAWRCVNRLSLEGYPSRMSMFLMYVDTLIIRHWRVCPTATSILSRQSSETSAGCTLRAATKADSQKYIQNKMSNYPVNFYNSVISQSIIKLTPPPPIFIIDR